MMFGNFNSQTFDKMMLRRHLCIFCIGILACGLISCDKEPATESQGTHYNRLLKTITKSSFSSLEWTVTFEYNNSSQVTTTRTSYLNSSGTDQETEIFYRNGSGRLDSSHLSSTGNAATNFTRTQLSYDGSGKLLKSIQTFDGVNHFKDSSLYFYSGNILQERNDYRSISGGAYSLLRRGFYTFDGAGNLTQAIFQWPIGNIVDTARFEYDTKINPMPFDRLIFYWAPFFYNDYKPVNNPTLLFTDGAESFNNEYTYAPNNKPLYRKSKVIGSANAFYETWYYYD